MTTETLITGTTTDTGSQAPAAAPTSSAVADATAVATNTQPATDAQVDPAKPAADAKPSGDSAAPPGAPEKYEFKAPEGATFDPALITDFETVARELNMPQEAAQKLVETMGPKVAAQYAAQQQEAFKTLNAGWIEATKSDKEFGGDKLPASLAVAKKAMDTTATPELRALLNESGLGNHPEIIRHFLKIGTAISEDRFVSGGGGSDAGKTTAQRMYPNMNP